MAVQFAPGHYHGGAAQGAQVFQRVAGGHQKVGTEAGGQGAGHAAQAGNAGIALGGGVQGKGPGNTAVLVEIIDLPPHIIVGDEGAAGVGAKAHRDAVFQTGFGAGDDAVEDDAAVEPLGFGGAVHLRVKQGIGQGGGDGGHQSGPTAVEKLQHLPVRGGAVLNGVHPVFQGNLYPLGAFGMGGHLQAPAVGLVTGSFYIFRRHLQNAGLAFYLGVQHAAGDHQLDDVRQVFGNQLHTGPGLGGAFGRVSQGTGHVPPGHRDRHVGGEDAGAVQQAGGDLIPHGGVHILHAAHGAQGGHAAHQLGEGVGGAELFHNMACIGGAGHGILFQLKHLYLYPINSLT